MGGSLEGRTVKITVSFSSQFETPIDPIVKTVTVVAGANTDELNVAIPPTRILSVYDSSNIPKPVPGPNGLFTGNIKVDISGNQVFAQYSGQAQPVGINIKIENLATDGAAPGTVAVAGQVFGVNTVYAPTYSATTQTLTMNWFLFGFQPGTTVNQTVFYDNKFDDPPIAGDDHFSVNVGQALSGVNILANDTDLDNGGPFGVVDISSVTKVDGQSFTPGTWIDLASGGQIKLAANGQLEFRDDGDFSDLARGATRTTSFNYTVSDSTSQSDVGTATITVTGVNQAPVLSVPSATVILAENGTTQVTGISIADADNDSQTVTISANHGALGLGTTAGLSGDLNGSDGTLSLSGSLANINAALATLSYVAAPNLPGTAQLTIDATDGRVHDIKTIDVSVTDVKPVLANATVNLAENSANGTAVATIAAAGDTNGLTYSISDGNADGAFRIDAATGIISVADATKLNFEALASHVITVGVDDEDSGSTVDSSAVVTINLTDVNEAPTNLVLSSASTSQTQASAGSVLATLDSADPDVGSTAFVYSLVSGNGSADNAKFQVDGSSLKAKDALAAGTYHIRLQTSDGQLSYQKEFAIAVADDVKPVIASVASPDGVYGIGDTIQITIQAGEAGLTLQTGTINGKSITGLTDHGDGSYTTVYTVQEGDASHPAGEDIPVSLQLKDAAGNMSDAYTVAIANPNGVIDAVRPTGSVPALTAASDTGTSAADGLTKETSLVFAGTGEVGATVELLDAANLNSVISSAVISDGSWSLAAAAQLEGAHDFVARYTDAAGNISTSAPTHVVVDTTAPIAAPDNQNFDLRAPGALASILTNDTDAVAVVAVNGAAGDIDQVVAGSSGGSFTISADGSVVFSQGNDFASLVSGDTATTSIDYSAVDLAGNTASSTLAVTVIGKNDAPTLAANTALSVVAGSSVTITNSALKVVDVDDVASGLTYKVTTLPSTGSLTLNGTALAMSDTFTQADIDAGHLKYIAGSAGSQSFGFSAADGGEDGAADLSGQLFTFNVTAAPSVPSDPGPTAPGGPPQTGVVDGVPVTTTPAADGSTTTTIPVVATSSSDPTDKYADVPLVKGTGGQALVEVGVPLGVGVTAQGQVTALSGAAVQHELELRIATLSGANPDLATSASAFLATLAQGDKVAIQTITINTGVGFDPTVPIVIHGSASADDGKQAVIVDASHLPSGTILKVDDIDFIAVSGPVHLTGGAGQNTAIGDSAAQWIVLGPDDDVLHGGAGDDIVGSEGGNDQIFGDDGNDTLFGGAGDDFISGGNGHDTALYHDVFSKVHVSLNAKGQLIIHGVEGTDTIEGVELIKLDDSSISFDAIDMSSSAGQAYRLYQAAFGRFADAGGLSYWTQELGKGHVGLTSMAKLFLTSNEFKATYGDASTVNNANFLNLLYENVLHRSADDGGYGYWNGRMETGMSRSDVLAFFAESGENVANVGNSDTQPIWH